MTDIHERLRCLSARTARVAKQPHSHYLIAGLAVAGLWLLNGDKSLVYHAVQMLIVMSVLTGLQIVADRHHGKTPAYIRLISAKLVLVAVAVDCGPGHLPDPVRSAAHAAAGTTPADCCSPMSLAGRGARAPPAPRGGRRCHRLPRPRGNRARPWPPTQTVSRPAAPICYTPGSCRSRYHTDRQVRRAVLARR